MGNIGVDDDIYTDLEFVQREEALHYLRYRWYLEEWERRRGKGGKERD